MNKVYLEIKIPDAVWTRGKPVIGAEGDVTYEAKFCKMTSVNKKPVHMGPSITLIVRDSAGKVISSKPSTIGIKSNGELFFHEYQEAESELEHTPGEAKKCPTPRDS